MTESQRNRLKIIKENWSDKKYRDELQYIIHSNLKSKRCNELKNL